MLSQEETGNGSKVCFSIFNPLVKDSGHTRRARLIVFFLLFAGWGAVASAITLEERCIRFLNTATFGPTQAEINALFASAEAKRLAGQTENNALLNSIREWIDDQFTKPTTYCEAW